MLQRQSEYFAQSGPRNHNRDSSDGVGRALQSSDFFRLYKGRQMAQQSRQRGSARGKEWNNCKDGPRLIYGRCKYTRRNSSLLQIVPQMTFDLKRVYDR
jgi:hypothetical protein